MTIDSSTRSINTFVKMGLVACFLSVITTLGIHSSIFSFGQLTFEESLTLPSNTAYITARYWIILHCLFVLISMWTIFILKFRESRGFISLGLLFYAVFAVAEIFRQLLILFYLNPIREAYLEADEVTQQIIYQQVNVTGFLGNTLFGLFILAFAIANLYYGIGLSQGDKRQKVIAYLLIFWSIMNLSAFGNEFWMNQTINKIINVLSISFQPAIRLFLGLWLVGLYKTEYYQNTD